MAKVQPFRAIRPTRDKVHLFATRSFLTYSKATIKDKLKNNPYTFLHIINPDSKKKIKQGVEKYKLVKKKFDDFQKSGFLIKDKDESFYIYKQEHESRKFEGIIAACSIDDYRKGVIKAHEKTIEKRKNIFTEFLENTCFNADPVLLCYKKQDKINKIISKVKKYQAEYDFTTTNKVRHQLWKIDNSVDIDLICKSFSKINNIYIADGHHRIASSENLATNKIDSKSPNLNFFMSLLITDNQLNIISFNRLIKNINDLESKEFIKRIKKTYIVNKCSSIIPKDESQIRMYINKTLYNLKPKNGSYKEDCVNSLETSILSNNILSPILGIKDERTDTNISFVSGKISIKEIKEQVDNGNYKVAFILNPITIEAIKQVADKGKIMPPKSTYIEPKLRSGIVIYPLDQ